MAQREWDALFQKESERDRIKAQQWDKERQVTEEDRRVWETLLLDLRTHKEYGSSLFDFEKGQPQIALENKTSGLFDEEQMNGELTESQAQEITVDIRQSLMRRNSAPISLTDFKPVHTEIVLVPSLDTSWRTFEKRHPKACGWAAVGLPGYSQDGNRVVVRFHFGPTPHGAAGTYMLRKEGGVWRTVWRNIAFYA